MWYENEPVILEDTDIKRRVTIRDEYYDGLQKITLELSDLFLFHIDAFKIHQAEALIDLLSAAVAQAKEMRKAPWSDES